MKSDCLSAKTDRLRIVLQLKIAEEHEKLSAKTFNKSLSRTGPKNFGFRYLDG